MNKFNDVIVNLNNIIYKPNELIITNLKEEQQNAEYAGCLFYLNHKSIRFRISKITPNKIGQFIFPKEIILKEKILKTQSQKGKMAMRIYPLWDTPVSNQAKKSQMWQLQYFVDLSDPNNLPIDKLLNLYL
ncbi:MepB family protein [Bacillus albus]|uniref:MepB family protein n=1 Tax=Bacillus albus TaxID=2026189 RepID=UPI003D1B4A10